MNEYGLAILALVLVIASVMELRKMSERVRKIDSEAKGNVDEND